MSDFVNHSYDYRPYWTPLGPITIIYQIVERGKPEYSEKTSRSRLNSHVTPSLEIEPGPHWWQANALTTETFAFNSISYPAFSKFLVEWRAPSTMPHQLTNSYRCRLRIFVFSRVFDRFISKSAKIISPATMAANNSLILGADLKKKSINITLKQMVDLKSSITELEEAVSQQCSTFCVVLPITRPLSRYAT